MRLGRILLALLMVAVLPSGAVAAKKRPAFGADDGRYLEGDLITITLTNDTNKDVTLEGDWIIARSGTDEAQANYVWPAEEAVVAPGQTRTWEWDRVHPLLWRLPERSRGLPGRTGRLRGNGAHLCR